MSDATDTSTLNENPEKLKNKKQGTWKVGHNPNKVPILPVSERNHLHAQDEVKILKNWRFLKNNIIIGNIMDPLIEKGIFTPDQWMVLKHNEVIEGEKVEELLYHVLKCKPDTYGIFTDALTMAGYNHVVSQLEGHKGRDSTPSASVSSSGNSSLRMTGRPQPVQNYPYQAPKNPPTPYKQGGHMPTPRTVKSDDLYQMKEEITGELRELRRNIERDRDHDRLELQVLQQKQIEMHEDLAKAVADRKQLECELCKVMETVNKLTTKMDEKNTEFLQMQEKIIETRHNLEQKSTDLQRMVAEKDKAAMDQSTRLKMKEIDYKKLQSTLESLKEEHEERLGRFKILNKEKIGLTKEVQTLQRERTNLKVKIKSLEEHIRILQVKHVRETSVIKEELEKQKTLLTDTEKEKDELAKKLEASIAENDNLKQYSKHLENTLQKTEDTKAHLVQKAKDNLAKYALPPFTVGRSGWNNRRNIKRP